MKYACASTLLLLMFTAGLWGAGPGEEYVRIYSLIQQGETLERANNQAEALAAYLDAQQGLIQLQRGSRDWNPKVVDFRLRYLQAKIDQLKPTAVVLPVVEPGTPATATAQMDSAMEEMNRELQLLRSDNSALQAKLKEALAIRPAAVDPKALEKSEQRSLELSKEVELLKSSLKEALATASQNPDAKTLKILQNALDQETQRADQLADERKELASQVVVLRASTGAVTMLREENALLKRQVSELQTTAGSGDNSAAQRQLNQLTTELALLRSEADILRLEKSALEQRMQALRDRPGASSTEITSELINSKARVNNLERERGQLQLQLARANQALAERETTVVGEPTGVVQAEVERLKARLAVYEAEKVPFSIEELALFRMSQGVSASDSSKPSPPSGVGPLVAEAERQFKQGQFQQAESTLKQILEKDESNAFTLSNLAATQMEQGRDAEAEVNLRKALTSAPRDPFSLATMGILQFRQGRYEEALDYLGLAVQYNPDNAVIHNYLGMALSEQGLRGPAETALRRAIQLQPGFGDAHFNLALVYVLQEPPSPALARWHYQKALAVGHQRSTEMEQLLDQHGLD